MSKLTSKNVLYCVCNLDDTIYSVEIKKETDTYYIVLYNGYDRKVPKCNMTEQFSSHSYFCTYSEANEYLRNKLLFDIARAEATISYKRGILERLDGGNND